MIRLRELPLDTRGRNSRHAESAGSNPDDQELDTTGLVAAVNREIESPNVPVSATTADIFTPPSAADDGRTLEPTSDSREPTDQETSRRQPQAKSNISRFLEKINLASTVLGFIVAVILGAISWSGLNYANYYAKKSYDLALYQACRSDESLRNSTACRTSLSTGISARSLANIRAEIGSLTADLSQAMIDPLVAYLQTCEESASGCLIMPSSPEVSYSNFISSIPRIRVRLLWALAFRLVAITTCRTEIRRLERMFPSPLQPHLHMLGVSLPDGMLAEILSILDCGYALEVSALGGQISRSTAAALACLFVTTAALPIIFATKNHVRILLLFTSAVVLAPFNAEISDVGANAALAMTSLACFTLLPLHVRQPASPAEEILQQEQEPLQNEVTSRQIGTLPDDTLEQGAADQGDDRSRLAESSGENTSRKTTDHGKSSKTVLETGDITFLRQNTLPMDEERIINEFRPGLSAPSPFLFTGLEVAGLLMTYSWSRELGGTVVSTTPGMPQTVQAEVIPDGYNIEEISVYEKALKERALYSIWGLLVASVGICIANAKGYYS